MGTGWNKYRRCMWACVTLFLYADRTLSAGGGIPVGMPQWNNVLGT